MSVRMSAARLLAVCLSTLSLLAQSPVASAADLDYHASDRYSQGGPAYDDPRYRDLYGDDNAGPPRYAPPRYVERYEPLPPPKYYPGSTKDGPYLAPMPYRPRFSDHPRYEDDRRHAGCLPRHVVKDRLRAEGWHDFHAPQVVGDLARVKARRPSGRLFVLQIDRCSGEIVHARRLDRDWRGPYANGPIYPPRGWSRTY